MSSSSSSMSATPQATPSPPDISESSASVVAKPLPEWQRRIGLSPNAASPPRNRDELVRSALHTLANLMLNKDPARRPTAADVLADLGSIQMMLG